MSLWYILLGKKNVLASLYRNTMQGQKVFEFLGHDFTQDRWKKAAGRNAYQLFSQKKYMLCAAFYLLGGEVNEATQVAITHLHDLQLAVTICRLVEGEGSGELKRIYQEYYIEKGLMYKDPWMTLMGRWLSGEYVKALNCISDRFLQGRHRPQAQAHRGVVLRQPHALHLQCFHDRFVQEAGETLSGSVPEIKQHR